MLLLDRGTQQRETVSSNILFLGAHYFHGYSENCHKMPGTAVLNLDLKKNLSYEYKLMLE